MAMTGAGQQSSFAARSGLPTFGNFGSTLLERSNPGLRKSTPDSEALASSDEEVEHSRLRSAAQRKTLPNRRSSLLGDQNGDTRRLSFTGSNSFSPNLGSQPNTPGASHDSWSAISPGAGAWNSGSSYPFGASIWGTNARDPPARLQEVLQDSAGTRVPFVTPGQPNPAVHRSMSFSVGQSEYDTPTTATDTNLRPGPGLTRRTSRPSNLGHEYGGLSRVNESEDNEPYYSSATHYTQSNRVSARAMSNVSNHANSSAFRGGRLRTSTHDATELAIEDVDEPAQLRQPIRGATSRRLSDFQPTVPTRQPNGPLFAGAPRNVPHWSSNLDFGQLDPIPQSRRHSFADVPTRRGSMGSNGMSRILLSC